MDPNRFDALVRALPATSTRRAAVQTLVGALAALGAGHLGLAPELAAGKPSGKAPTTATGKASGKVAAGKPGGNASAKAHATAHDTGPDAAAGKTGGKPAATAAGQGSGAPKKKHHHHHHGGGGTCTTGAAGEQGSSVTQTSQTSFNGQILQATQTVQPVGANHATASQLDVTLAGAPLLTIAIAGQDRAVTVTITYGAALQGIQRAQFVNDGTTITGDIDGRAIVPLPATSDPSKTRFADGAPPPDVQVDPDLAKAIQTLLHQAHQAAKTCRPAPATAAARRRGMRPTSHPEENAGCLALYIPCASGQTICLYGVAGGCVAALFGYGICVGIGVAACEYAALVCRKTVRVGGTCCPVTCGGSTDVANPFSDDPSCCEHGETCVNPDSNQSACCPAGTQACAGVNCCKPDETCQPNGQCCAPGASLCGEVCCPNGSCQNGQCCDLPNVTCGAACCAPFSSCCAGQCCTGICTNGICCVAPATYCNGSCCANTCCNGVCCPAGQSCVNGNCAVVCTVPHYACPNVPGNPPCCLTAHTCCPGVGCCDIGLQCCAIGNGLNACKTTCVA